MGKGGIERWVVLGPAEGGGPAAIIFAENAPHENLRWEFCFPPGRLWSDLGTVMLYWKYLQWDQTSSQKMTRYNDSKKDNIFTLKGQCGLGERGKWGEGNSHGKRRWRLFWCWMGNKVRWGWEVYKSLIHRWIWISVESFGVGRFNWRHLLLYIFCGRFMLVKVGFNL